MERRRAVEERRVFSSFASFPFFAQYFLGRRWSLGMMAGRRMSLRKIARRDYG